MICWKAYKSMLVKKFYLPSAAVVFVLVFSLLSYLVEFLFFSPFFVFYVPLNEMLTFLLITIIAILAALTIPITVYQMATRRFRLTSSRDFLSVLLGVGAGCGCALAFNLISFVGLAGSVLVGFLNFYQTPIRLISISLLGYSFYVDLKILSRSSGCS